ncbi:hemerythrin domain-containing protein [Aureimonas sp. AU12]|uniref:hemerythrin domain-containing protein n=1 Tax=Aureimonas sp. AU12 TaxID=1638161 RepID=UPI000ABABEAC|nr:hemerythrin domain-containing protein [Aureimonas sp. AU12]
MGLAVKPTFDLDTRHGLPADLRELLLRYPRDVWTGHRNLGPTARFWLQRHDMFRELGGALDEALGQQREQVIDLGQFRVWFVPRLNFFLTQLDEHHRIEDTHYFPVFQLADARLAHGFDLLEGDHEVIHRDLQAVAETAGRFLQETNLAGGKPGDTARRASEAYSDASERLLRRLVRHQEDEEDLIIPMILDRSEPGLGI